MVSVSLRSLMAAQRPFFYLRKLSRQRRKFSTHFPTVSSSSNSAQTLCSDSFLLEKILWALKRGQTINTHLFYQLNPSAYAHILHECRNNLHVSQQFIDGFALNCPNFRHSSRSLSAAVRVLVRSKRISDSQALILRMIRRSGASRVDIVDSLLGTCEKCGSSLLVFDLLIRTYVQARKFREAVEAFRLLKLRNVCVSINACNCLLGGLAKIGWVDLVRNLNEELVRNRSDFNAYTLNIMVNVFKDGKIELAKEFLMEMEKIGIFGDIVTYNTLIRAYCCEGRVYGKVLN